MKIYDRDGDFLTEVVGETLTGAHLRGADLWQADLWQADLRRADLQGVDLDFSCWPLWCGSLRVRIDERLAKQLLYHTISAIDHSGIDCSIPNTLRVYANGFHQVISEDVPKLEVTGDE